MQHLIKLLSFLLLFTISNSFAQNTSIKDSLITTGSGKFLFKNITVHYYCTQKTSSVIFIIPGAGRNGDDYRDAWIAHADKYNLLILSPEYSEDNYPGFWNYNLGRMIKDVKIKKDRSGIESYTINANKEEWIFNDFDEIFEKIKNSLKLKVNTYDLFGHSAGGQILHRLALFHPNSKGNRILASNAGWYTVPDKEAEFPYGLKNSPATISFNTRLVIFLGEKDDENETRGDLVRTKDVDVQGTYRFARGKYFYEKAAQHARKLNLPFKWKLKIIPGIGHDYKAMSNAAAKYLYEGND